MMCLSAQLSSLTRMRCAILILILIFDLCDLKIGTLDSPALQKVYTNLSFLYTHNVA